MADFNRVINESKNLTAAILGMHRDKLEEAFEKNDKSLSINLGVKLSSGEGGDVKVESSISFIEGKVKDAITTTVTDQMEIPGI